MNDIDGWRLPLLGGSRWLLPLLLLGALAFRLVLVNENDVISRDGLNYVGWAQMIESGEVQGIPDKYMLNPYPLLIGVVARLGISHVLAGQLISAVAATLALLPLYWYCRSAFGRPVAEMVALIYTVHPTLAYVSSEVLREGLYWLLGFSAIAVFWSAVQQNSWWRFLIGSVLGVAATLTRVEGILIFILAGMWWTAHVWPQRRQLIAVVWKPAVAIALLCAVLIGAAAVLVPADDWDKWQLVAMARDYAETHESAQADLSPASGPDAWQAMSPRRSLKYLAESLPAHQYKQTRLIDLAKDHLWWVYVADLGYHVTKAFEFPAVICIFIALYWGRARFWRGERDWPLVIQAALVFGILLHHLATEHVISTRYAFALIPFVLPWTSMGFFQFLDWFGSKMANVRRKSLVRLATCSIVACLAVISVSRSFHYLRDGKVLERELGELVRKTSGKKTVIACPQKWRRVPFYAKSEYTKLMIPPRADLNVWLKENIDWLRRNDVEFLLLERNYTIFTNARKTHDETPPDLEPLFEDDPRFHKLRIYRVIKESPPVAKRPGAGKRS